MMLKGLNIWLLRKNYALNYALTFYHRVPKNAFKTFIFYSVILKMSFKSKFPIIFFSLFKTKEKWFYSSWRHSLHISYKMSFGHSFFLLGGWKKISEIIKGRLSSTRLSPFHLFVGHTVTQNEGKFYNTGKFFRESSLLP